MLPSEDESNNVLSGPHGEQSDDKDQSEQKIFDRDHQQGTSDSLHSSEIVESLDSENESDQAVCKQEMEEVVNAQTEEKITEVSSDTLKEISKTVTEEDNMFKDEEGQGEEADFFDDATEEQPPGYSHEDSSETTNIIGDVLKSEDEVNTEIFEGRPQAVDETKEIATEDMLPSSEEGHHETVSEEYAEQSEDDQKEPVLDEIDQQDTITGMPLEEEIVEDTSHQTEELPLTFSQEEQQIMEVSNKPKAELLENAVEESGEYTEEDSLEVSEFTDKEEKYEADQVTEAIEDTEQGDVEDDERVIDHREEMLPSEDESNNVLSKDHVEQSDDKDQFEKEIFDIDYGEERPGYSHEDSSDSANCIGELEKTVYQFSTEPLEGTQQAEMEEMAVDHKDKWSPDEEQSHDLVSEDYTLQSEKAPITDREQTSADEQMSNFVGETENVVVETGETTLDQRKKILPSDDETKEIRDLSSEQTVKFAEELVENVIENALAVLQNSEQATSVEESCESVTAEDMSFDTEKDLTLDAHYTNETLAGYDEEVDYPAKTVGHDHERPIYVEDTNQYDSAQEENSAEKDDKILDSSSETFNDEVTTIVPQLQRQESLLMRRIRSIVSESDDDEDFSEPQEIGDDSVQGSCDKDVFTMPESGGDSQYPEDHYDSEFDVTGIGYVDPPNTESNYLESYQMAEHSEETDEDRELDSRQGFSDTSGSVTSESTTLVPDDTDGPLTSEPLEIIEETSDHEEKPELPESGEENIDQGTSTTVEIHSLTKSSLGIGLVGESSVSEATLDGEKYMEEEEQQTISDLTNDNKTFDHSARESSTDHKEEFLSSDEQKEDKLPVMESPSAQTVVLTDDVTVQMTDNTAQIIPKDVQLNDEESGNTLKLETPHSQEQDTVPLSVPEDEFTLDQLTQRIASFCFDEPSVKTSDFDDVNSTGLRGTIDTHASEHPVQMLESTEEVKDRDTSSEMTTETYPIESEVFGDREPVHMAKPQTEMLESFEDFAETYIAMSSSIGTDDESKPIDKATTPELESKQEERAGEAVREVVYSVADEVQHTLLNVETNQDDDHSGASDTLKELNKDESETEESSTEKDTSDKELVEDYPVGDTHDHLASKKGVKRLDEKIESNDTDLERHVTDITEEDDSDISPGYLPSNRYKVESMYESSLMSQEVSPDRGSESSSNPPFDIDTTTLVPSSCEEDKFEISSYIEQDSSLYQSAADTPQSESNMISTDASNIVFEQVQEAKVIRMASQDFPDEIDLASTASICGDGQAAFDSINIKDENVPETNDSDVADARIEFIHDNTLVEVGTPTGTTSKEELQKAVQEQSFAPVSAPVGLPSRTTEKEELMSTSGTISSALEGLLDELKVTSDLSQTPPDSTTLSEESKDTDANLTEVKSANIELDDTEIEDNVEELYRPDEIETKIEDLGILTPPESAHTESGTDSLDAEYEMVQVDDTDDDVKADIHFDVEDDWVIAEGKKKNNVTELEETVESIDIQSADAEAKASTDTKSPDDTHRPRIPSLYQRTMSAALSGAVEEADWQMYLSSLVTDEDDNLFTEEDNVKSAENQSQERRPRIPSLYQRQMSAALSGVAETPEWQILRETVISNVQQIQGREVDSNDEEDIFTDDTQTKSTDRSSRIPSHYQRQMSGALSGVTETPEWSAGDENNVMEISQVTENIQLHDDEDKTVKHTDDESTSSAALSVRNPFAVLAGDTTDTTSESDSVGGKILAVKEVSHKSETGRAILQRQSQIMQESETSESKDDGDLQDSKKKKKKKAKKTTPVQYDESELTWTQKSPVESCKANGDISLEGQHTGTQKKKKKQIKSTEETSKDTAVKDQHDTTPSKLKETETATDHGKRKKKKKKSSSSHSSVTGSVTGDVKDGQRGPFSVTSSDWSQMAIMTEMASDATSVSGPSWAMASVLDITMEEKLSDSKTHERLSRSRPESLFQPSLSLLSATAGTPTIQIHPAEEHAKRQKKSRQRKKASASPSLDRATASESDATALARSLLSPTSASETELTSVRQQKKKKKKRSRSKSTQSRSPSAQPRERSVTPSAFGDDSDEDDQGARGRAMSKKSQRKSSSMPPSLVSISGTKRRRRRRKNIVVVAQPKNF